MKINKIITGVLVASCATIASADVTIVADKTVSILAVNESKPDISSGGMFSSVNTIHLPNGINQIVFKYEPYFDPQAGDQDKRVFLSSEAIIARFEASDTNLTFVVPEYKDGREAEANIGNLTWSLQDKQGNAIAVFDDILTTSGVQVGRDYRRESEDYNRKRMGPAAISLMPLNPVATEISNAPVVSNTAPIASHPAPADTAEEMLIFWYNKATAETRMRFKQYVNQNQ
jgi:uncharacterized protein YccT (UPF0319 family)